MNAFIETIRNLGVARLAAMAGIAIALIGFFIFAGTRFSTGKMDVLFNDLNPQDSAVIVGHLQAQNVPYELSPDNTQINVPATRVNQLRLQLAEQGLPASTVGYEIFDREQALGISSFVQNINQVRALEGELARTIASLKTVKGARVHLVLPRRELFSRERQQPSASVILQMRSATRLTRGQVAAVQHLVAAAVPKLQLDGISVVDDRGTLLARGSGDGNQTIGASAAEMQATLEAQLAQKLQELIEPTVGIGNVRAEVRVEMDLDRVVTNQEIYDPDGQVVRSTQSITENSSNTEPGQQPVTVGRNLPDSPDTNTSKNQSASTRTEESTNFEISKTIRKQVQEAGEINRISVAVLVNGRFTTASEGKSEYQPRQAAELENIQKLVKTAVGYNAKRGDTVEVVNMQFAPLPETIDPDQVLFMGLKPADIRRLVEVVVLAILGVLIVLLVVRPLIAKIFEVTPQAVANATAAAEQRYLTSAGTPALEGPDMGGVALPAMTGDDNEVDADRLINLDQVDGRVKASSVRKVNEIIDKHPTEAVSIVRSWMYQEQS